MNKKLLAGLAMGLLVLGLTGAANATVINFDNLRPFANYAHIPDGYGSTAEVAVSYQTLDTNFNQALNFAELWNEGYANLHTAAYAGANGYILGITLTAINPNETVLLNSFDVAAYSGPGHFTQLASILEVRDGSGTVLKNYAPYPVSGWEAETLAPGVSAHSISILLGTNWNNGINHIDFSTNHATPEPATLLLLGSGLAGLLGARRQKKAQA